MRAARQGLNGHSFFFKGIIYHHMAPCTTLFKIYLYSPSKNWNKMANTKKAQPLWKQERQGSGFQKGESTGGTWSTFSATRHFFCPKTTAVRNFSMRLACFYFLLRHNYWPFSFCLLDNKHLCLAKCSLLSPWWRSEAGKRLQIVSFYSEHQKPAIFPWTESISQVVKSVHNRDTANRGTMYTNVTGSSEFSSETRVAALSSGYLSDFSAPPVISHSMLGQRLQSNLFTPLKVILIKIKTWSKTRHGSSFLEM